MRAEEAKRVPGKENFVVLDGVLMEVGTTTAKEMDAAGVRGMDLLRAHQKWELEYTSKVNSWPEIRPSSQTLDLGLRGIPVLFWGYDVPGKLEVLGETVVRIAYVTAAVDDVVFVLSVPLRPGDDVRVPAQKTGQIMRTLKRLEHRVDVHSLAAEVKETVGIWRDCRIGGD
jgi:hypothetical protein